MAYKHSICSLHFINFFLSSADTLIPPFQFFAVFSPEPVNQSILPFYYYHQLSRLLPEFSLLRAPLKHTWRHTFSRSFQSNCKNWHRMVSEFYNKPLIFILHSFSSWLNCKAFADSFPDLCLLLGLPRQSSGRSEMAVSFGS